jgi:hypothetical protein
MLYVTLSFAINHIFNGISNNLFSFILHSILLKQSINYMYNLPKQ